MAIDKLVDSTELDNGLTTIADAIRTKGGTSALLTFPDGMAQAVADIPTGIIPTGSITLTEENTYDVTDKASAVVDFSATRADLAEAVTAKGVDTLPTASFDTITTNIGLIEGGGGGEIDVKSAIRCEIVTVGANTVSDAVAAVEYFGYTTPYAGLSIILLDAPTIQNQFGFVAIKKDATLSGATFPWWRWRDNAPNYPNTFSASWSAELVQGTKYLVVEW